MGSTQQKLRDYSHIVEKKYDVTGTAECDNRIRIMAEFTETPSSTPTHIYFINEFRVGYILICYILELITSICFVVCTKYDKWVRCTGR